jgi:hypothetical protein
VEACLLLLDCRLRLSQIELVVAHGQDPAPARVRLSPDVMALLEEVFVQAGQRLPWLSCTSFDQAVNLMVLSQCAQQVAADLRATAPRFPLDEALGRKIESLLDNLSHLHERGPAGWLVAWWRWGSVARPEVLDPGSCLLIIQSMEAMLRASPRMGLLLDASIYLLSGEQLGWITEMSNMRVSVKRIADSLRELDRDSVAMAEKRLSEQALALKVADALAALHHHRFDPVTEMRLDTLDHLLALSQCRMYLQMDLEQASAVLPASVVARLAAQSPPPARVAVVNEALSLLRQMGRLASADGPLKPGLCATFVLRTGAIAQCISRRTRSGRTRWLDPQLLERFKHDLRSLQGLAGPAIGGLACGYWDHFYDGAVGEAAAALRERTLQSLQYIFKVRPELQPELEPRYRALDERRIWEL